ncbi:MAG: OB-fold domain-containing protein [Dehalococcoidia bacterium]|nr:OB-fold domain-containing protein [Dehalococcoidia bacterium]
MTKIEKPLPEITPDKKTFWEAAYRHELLLMKCSYCGHYRMPLYAGDSYMCSDCNSTQPPLWVKSSGKGKIITWTTVHRAFHPSFADEVPYIVALVLLNEGVRMFANLRGIKPEDIHENQEVEVFFEKLSAEIMLPQFHPVTG